MSGDDIYRLFHKEGLSDSHIDVYAEFVRQRDFPIQRKNDQLRIQAEAEREKNEQEEQQKRIDQYKASSRLDKLKKKLNIVK